MWLEPGRESVLENEVEKGGSGKIMTGFVGHGRTWGFIFRVMGSHNIPLVCITLIYLPDSSNGEDHFSFLFLKMPHPNMCVCENAFVQVI